MGTFDANGAPAKSIGSIRIDVHVGAPGPPNDTDVMLTASMSDVRCKRATSACGNANSAGGADYTGELQGDAMIRITDHFNTTTAGGGTDAATVVEIPFPINLVCTSTADTSIGGTCDVNTYCPLPESCAPEGDRSVVQITQLRVYDGRPDGIVVSDP